MTKPILWRNNMLTKTDIEQLSDLVKDLCKLTDKIANETILSDYFNNIFRRYVLLKYDYSRLCLNAIICRDIMTCFSSLGNSNENNEGYDIIQYIFYGLYYEYVTDYEDYLTLTQAPAVNQNFHTFYQNIQKLYDCYPGKLLLYSALFSYNDVLRDKYLKMLRRVFNYLYKRSSKSKIAKNFYCVLKNDPLHLLIDEEEFYYVEIEDLPVSYNYINNELVTDIDQVEEYLNEQEKIVITNENNVLPIDDLDNLIGLQSVKKNIYSLTSLIDINNKRKDNGLKSTPISCHCIFIGNPGTGKKTVAKILGDFFYYLGKLSSLPILVETDRSSFVGKDIKQTINKTNKVIDSAIDSILYIEDAYTLDNGKNNLGKLAIATLLKRMDDYDNFIVVLSGCHEKMKTFIDNNPEIGARFHNSFHFPDYTSSELLELFQLFAIENDHQLLPDAIIYLKKRFDKIVSNKKNNFRNALFVRDYFELASASHIHRMTTQLLIDEGYFDILTKEDVQFKLTDLYKIAYE